MKARVVKVAEEEGLETIIEIGGHQYEAMDCLAYSTVVSVGQILDVEFHVGVANENESLDDILSGNPNKEMKLDHIEGWSYRAYGKIVTVNPCIVNCGDVEITKPFELEFSNIIGKYVAFDIDRLDVWLALS